MIGVRKKALTIPPTKANVKGYQNGLLQPFILLHDNRKWRKLPWKQ
ncbi:hypothetical protein P7D77_12175 [Enterococcus avium]|nr:hypothetical protein [Enterococcus avium]MDT2398714.1 hypothetical protein [Enterococcus avium]